MIPWIIKNENTDKIEVVEEFDEKCNVMRITVKEKFPESTQDEPLCKYCGTPIKIRNPTGNCDHLYYPELVNKSFLEDTKSAPIKPSKHIIDMEGELCDKIDEYFPETNPLNRDRTKAFILINLAKELGVQGHSDNIKQKSVQDTKSAPDKFWHCLVCDEDINEDEMCKCMRDYKKADRDKLCGCGHSKFEHTYKDKASRCMYSNGNGCMCQGFRYPEDRQSEPRRKTTSRRIKR